MLQQKNAIGVGVGLSELQDGHQVRGERRCLTCVDTGMAQGLAAVVRPVSSLPNPDRGCNNARSSFAPQTRSHIQMLRGN